MRKRFHIVSCLFFLFSIVFATNLEAQAKRKDIGKLVFERKCFDVFYYGIKVKIEPKDKFISGSNCMTFKMVQESSKIQLDYTQKMKLDSVVFKGIRKSFKRKGNKVFIEFLNGLKKDSTYQLDLYFSGNPLIAKLAPWDGGFVWSKDKNGYDWVGLACEGLGASVWLPCKDHWSDEANGMDMTLIVPKELFGVSNGKLLEEKELELGFKAYHWQVKNPINNYNISINIGRYVNFKDTFLGIYKLPLSYYVLDYNQDAAERHFLQVHGMLSAFEHFFGQYPFQEDGYKLVETPYWGMEHQSCIAYGNNYKFNEFGFDFIIIHESGHEWFANSITASDASDMWIHESFTTYSEALYLEYITNRTRAVEYLLEQRRKIVSKHPMQGPRGVFYHGRTDSDIYYKGTWMLHTMRSILDNDSLWFSCIKAMNKKYFHKIVSTEEVVQFFNENTRYNWNLFFEQYLYKSSIPILEIKHKALANGKIQYILELESNIKGFEIPINIHASQGQVIRFKLSKEEIVIELNNQFDLVAYLNANYLLNIKQE